MRQRDVITELEDKMKTDFTLVHEALGKARKWGLETEVVYSALTMAAEANEHGQTMEQVLEAALGEWDI